MTASALPKRSAAATALLFTASMAVLAALAGCETPPPPPPVAAPLAEVPAPQAPPVLLPRGVVEQASVYQGYVQQTATIDPGFTGGDKIQDSLKTAERYETTQLQQGQTAFGAIVALQDQTFVSGLREFAKDPGQRSQIAAQIMADPSYAASFKGADSAAGLVIAAYSDQGHKLIDLGGRIKQAAYDVQHQPWSKADVPDRPGRLALAKTLSSERQQPIELDALRMAAYANGSQPMGVAAPPVAPPYTTLVNRALAVAAMAALGMGGEEYSPQLTALLSDTVEGQCLHLAKLNLYQCLSVAKPHYEDVFCLGQHAVGETGQCMMKGAVAGYAIPPLVAPRPASEPAAVQSASKSRGKKKSSSKGANSG